MEQAIEGGATPLIVAAYKAERQTTSAAHDKETVCLDILGRYIMHYPYIGVV